MSSGDTNIETVWNHLLVLLVRISENVSESNRTLYWSDGYSRNGTFPFRGFMSFSRSGDPNDEDLVFSLDCKKVGEIVKCTSDFADGDGVIVADGPSLRINDLSNTEKLWRYQAEILDFFEESKQILESRLE